MLLGFGMARCPGRINECPGRTNHTIVSTSDLVERR
jgi:hypothetical protein